MIKIQNNERYYWIDIDRGDKTWQYTYFDNDAEGVLYVEMDGYISPYNLGVLINSEHYFPLIYLYCFWNKAP